MYSGKTGCIRAKVVVFGQKWLYSGIVIVIGQNWLYSGKSGCNRVKWLHSGKVVVFGQKCLYSGKSVSIYAKIAVVGEK